MTTATETTQIYSLELGQLPATPFVAVGHTLQLPALPNLTPPAFTRDQQLANPNSPMTRVVKDVLRVGRWKAGRDRLGNTRFWNVTTQEINDLAANFKVGQRNGLAMNLYWGQPVDKAGGQHNVETRDAIAPIDQLIASGDTLWMTSYVTPQQATDLKNPANKVSIRSMEGFSDGQGHVYSLMLLHVAVVDNPVVGGQGPFMDLANDHYKQLFSTPQKRTRDMALDFARTVEQLNTILPGEITLPENVTEDNLNDVLDVILDTIGKATGEATAEAESGGAGGGESEVAGTAGAGGSGGEQRTPDNFAIALQPLTDAVRSLANDVQSLKSENASKQKAAYATRLNELGKAGVAATTITKLQTLGEKHGYDLALLDTVSATIDMSNNGKSGASGAAPKIDLANSGADDDEIEKHLKEQGLKPVKLSPV